MDKFIDEEKNMLENDPEIRDTSLRRKPSFFEKLLWNGRRKSTTLTALAIAVPTAIVCALSACAPQADEEQQKAYASYVAAFEKYQTAVNEYNKLEVTDKPALPQSLVIANDLDDKATTEQLKNKTEDLNNATAEINELRETLKNNASQQAAYQNYLSAWDTYANTVAEYDKLENAEKPALPANLVLSKDLDEKSTTKALNDARTALETATAEINKLIKQYEQETPTPPETDKPMTKEEIVEKVTSAVETTLQNVIGTGVEIQEYIALDYKEESGKYYVDAFVKYKDARSTREYNGYRLIRIPMKSAMSEENLKNGTFLPTSKYNGSNIIDIPSKSQDARDKEVLAKLNPALAETNPKFISLTNVAGDVISIGGTNEIKLFVINDNGITVIKTNARSDGDRIDPIGQSILAESAEIGKDYTKPTIETYEFGENVILLGEMFQGGQAQEYENIDA